MGALLVDLFFHGPPVLGRGAMLLCTARRRHWKTVGLTAGLVAAFRSSRPSQEGKKRQRTDSCSGRGKAPTAARGTNTAERVPLPAEGTTCRPNPSSEPLPQPSRGGTGGVRDRWHGLTDQTKPHLWDLGKLWNCQYYWESFLRTMTASQSSSGSSGSSKEDAGAGNGTPAPPPEGVPEATGNAKKKEDRRNQRGPPGSGPGEPPSLGAPGRAGVCPEVLQLRQKWNCCIGTPGRNYNGYPGHTWNGSGRDPAAGHMSCPEHPRHHPGT